MNRTVCIHVAIRLALLLALFSFECGRLQGQQERCRFCLTSTAGSVR